MEGLNMKVHKPGSYLLLHSEQKVQVLSVQIKESGVTYEVMWWSGETRNTAWISECEILKQIAPAAKLQVGFT